jgi:hypothetical protein
MASSLLITSAVMGEDLVRWGGRAAPLDAASTARNAAEPGGRLPKLFANINFELSQNMMGVTVDGVECCRIAQCHKVLPYYLSRELC